jgi:opacity protein-like surface antigen
VKSSIVSRYVLGAVLTLVLAAPAAAQTAQAQDKPVVGVGFSFMHTGQNGPGVSGNVAVPFRHLNSAVVSIVGDAGFNHFPDFTNLSLFGGVRFTMTSQPKLQPYIQAGVGAMLHHSSTPCPFCSDNAFGLAAGAGVRYPVNPQLGAFAELDLGRAKFGGFGYNGYRFVAGVSFEVGK